MDSYDSILALSDNASYIVEGGSHIINNVYDFVRNIPQNRFGNPMSPYAIDLYQKSLAMTGYSIVHIRELIVSFTDHINLSSFSPLDFRDTLIGFHSKIAFWASIRDVGMFISNAILLVGGSLIFAMGKKHGTRYDPVRDTEYPSTNNESNNSQKSNYTNNSSILQGTSASGGTSGSGGGDDNGDRNNNKPNKDRLDIPESSVSRSTMIAVRYVMERLRLWRVNNPHAEGPETEWYGAPLRSTFDGIGNLNGVVTLAQVIRYAIVHPDEIVPELGTPLRVLLSESALERIPPKLSFPSLFRGTYGSGRNLHNFLRDYEAIKKLLGTPLSSETIYDLLNKKS